MSASTSEHPPEGASERPVGWSPGRLVAVAAVLAAVLAVALALRVPAGLPYDEPSHFATVQWYGTEHRMPVLGDPGVTYEAQMGPVYYSVAGAVFALVDALAGERAGFLAARMLGAAVMVGLAWVSFHLLRVVVPSRPWLAAWATALFVLNPPVLFVVSSVQNDGLVMLATIAFLWSVMTIIRDGAAEWRDGLVLGLLATIAVLTKVNSAVIIAPALVAVLLALRRRDAVRCLSAAGVVGIALTGWWFVRNQVLYGSFDGRTGIERTGVEFPGAELSFRSTVDLVRNSLFAYIWTPVEYLRNLVRTPRWWLAASVVATGASIVGWLLPGSAGPRFPEGPSSRRVTPARAALGITVVAAAVFALLYFRSSAMGGRFLYPLFPFVTLALVLGLSRLIGASSRWIRRPAAVEQAVFALLTILGVLVTLQLAVAVGDLGDLPFEIRFA